MECSEAGCSARANARGLCPKHYTFRWKRGTLPPLRARTSEEVHAEVMQRLWARVDRRAPGDCWPWLKPSSSGYGLISAEGRNVSVHRLVYVDAYGPMPTGLEVDHVCHDPAVCQGGDACPHRRCCNPAHLRATTHAGNSSRGRRNNAQSRKTHCKNGHPYDEENTAWVRRGRNCRACGREAARRYEKRRRALQR